jgi:hypothetical protein
VVNKVILVSSYPADTTGIQNVYVNDALKIVPNPFNSSAVLTVKGMGANLQLEIYNLMGKLMRIEQFTGDTLILESKNLSSGTYFIKVSSSEGKHTYTKILIN